MLGASADPAWAGPQAMVVLGCAAWMAVSSGLILVNKHCMSVDGFAYPMALSGLGMAFSSVASFLCCKVAPALPPRSVSCAALPARRAPAKHPSQGSLQPAAADWLLCRRPGLAPQGMWAGAGFGHGQGLTGQPPQVLGLVEVKHKMTSQFYVTRIMPIGLFMALTLYFGNIVYLYLTVSFIQMLKVEALP